MPKNVPLTSGHRILMKESDWNWPWIEARKKLLPESTSFIPSDYNVFIDGDVPFVLYIAKNLQNKPKSYPFTRQRPRSDFDPFYDPPKNTLYIASPSDKYSIIFNKFNLVENHLVLVTDRFELQTDPLTLADFDILWKCISRLNMLGFYNSGLLSGASEMHKHMQLLPLPILRESVDMDLDLPIEKLIQDDPLKVEEAMPFINYKIPFYNQCFLFDTSNAPQEIIVRKICDAYNKIMNSITKHLSLLAERTISYNLLLTKRWMLVVPRSRETYQNSQLSINSLAFSGSLFVKNMGQFKLIQELGPINILKQVTFPHVHNKIKDI